MAYADDAALISEVQQSAQRLNVAATWASGKVFDVQKDFLYEMYLLFKVVNALSAHYSLVYEPGVGKNIHAFPRKPAAKAGRPRFSIKDTASGPVRYQLCAGTTVRDFHGHSRGLDLSIQSAASPDDPGPNDVIQIFDAKYRMNLDDRIAHGEFSEFSRWIELFNLRGVNTPGLNFGSLPEMDANCLITNGKYSTECDAECVRTSIREISQFYPALTYQCRP